MGRAIYHEVIGKGRDLVLLHGFGFNIEIWQHIKIPLAKKFKVTLIDLPGFGKSEPIEASNGPFNAIEHLLLILNKILEYVPKTAIWLGWSLGGLLVILCGYFYPTRISHGILVGSSPKFLASNGWPGLSLQQMNKFLIDLENDFYGTMNHFMLLQCLGLKGSRPILHFLQAMITQNVPHMCTLKDSLLILKESDLRDYYVNLSCPILHILGENDKIVPMSIAKILKNKSLKHHFYCMKQATHIPFLSHQKLFIKKILEFLKEK